MVFEVLPNNITSYSNNIQCLAMTLEHGAPGFHSRDGMGTLRVRVWVWVNLPMGYPRPTLQPANTLPSPHIPWIPHGFHMEYVYSI